MNQWWGRRGPGARVAIVVGALLVAFNVATSIAGSLLGGDPSGPTSSSYATAHDGLSAWATVLREDGHDVVRLRDTLDRATLDAGETLVVADPEAFQPGELEAVIAFVHGGGQLVVTGGSGSPLAELLVARLRWEPGGPQLATAMVDAPDIGSARSVRTAGFGSWSDAGDGTTVLAGDGGLLLVVADAGAGHVVALADTSPLTNELLADADNAALAIAVVGDDGRPVRFAEAAHGYRSGGGLNLPPGWDGALGGLTVSALVWMWSRGRRLGPPVEEEEVPAPPRRAYIDAMAATVARAGSTAEAAEPLRARARSHLARRAGVDVAVADEELRRAALRAGVDAEVVEGVLAVPTGDGSLLDLGRIAARLEARPEGPPERKDGS